MWGDSGPIPSVTNSRFGPNKTDNTPHEFNIGGKRVECYFSPSDNVNNKLINTINTADNAMYFASMVITRSDLAQAITDKVALGVDAFGLTQTTTGTLTWNQLINGMQANHMLANIDSANSIMHHKYIIIDQQNNGSDPQVWTGSHNWSNNANNKNDENTVVIHDQNIANQFYQEFHSRFIQNGGIVLNTITPQVSNNQIKLFPNPTADDKISIILSKEVINGNIIIYNLQGKVVSTFEIKSLIKQNQLDLNISNLSQGIYFIEISTNTSKELKRLVRL
jgi:hypothetical protein